MAAASAPVNTETGLIGCMINAGRGRRVPFVYKSGMTGHDGGSRKDSHYARLRRAHRDRTGRDAAPDAPPGGMVRLYGLHTVAAAIENPRRRIHSLHVTRNAAARLELGDVGALPFPVEQVEPKSLDRLCGPDAVHQGAVLEAEPLEPKRLADLRDDDLIVVLDRITDPHNVGAIMRSAVAFNAGALVTASRHSPAESGVLAKAASGALEHIDLITVRNLADALDDLKNQGFQTIGLDSEGPTLLENAVGSKRVALVLGAEGKGLRRKTRRTVAVLARLDMPGAIRPLNVSNAAAISLYVARSRME